MDGHREELGVGGAIPHLGEDGGELVGKALYVRTGTLALFKVMKRREMHRRVGWMAESYLRSRQCWNTWRAKWVSTPCSLPYQCCCIRFRLAEPLESCETVRELARLERGGEDSHDLPVRHSVKYRHSNFLANGSSSVPLALLAQIASFSSWLSHLHWSTRFGRTK